MCVNINNMCNICANAFSVTMRRSSAGADDCVAHRVGSYAQHVNSLLNRRGAALPRLRCASRCDGCATIADNIRPNGSTSMTH